MRRLAVIAAILAATPAFPLPLKLSLSVTPPAGMDAHRGLFTSPTAMALAWRTVSDGAIASVLAETERRAIVTIESDAHSFVHSVGLSLAESGSPRKYRYTVDVSGALASAPFRFPLDVELDTEHAPWKIAVSAPEPALVPDAVAAYLEKSLPSLLSAETLAKLLRTIQGQPAPATARGSGVAIALCLLWLAVLPLLLGYSIFRPLRRADA